MVKFIRGICDIAKSHVHNPPTGGAVSDESIKWSAGLVESERVGIKYEIPIMGFVIRIIYRKPHHLLSILRPGLQRWRNKQHRKTISVRRRRDTQRESKNGWLGYSGARRRWCGPKPPTRTPRSSQTAPYSLPKSWHLRPPRFSPRYRRRRTRRTFLSLLFPIFRSPFPPPPFLSCFFGFF